MKFNSKSFLPKTAGMSVMRVMRVTSMMRIMCLMGLRTFKDHLGYSGSLAMMVCLGLVSGPLMAQSYPSKPIRLVCPFPAGGAVDIASRAIAQEFTKSMGIAVTIDNRPGAGGNIGSQEVVRAPADGYTLLMTSSAIQAINPFLYNKMSFDPSRDLQPISVLVSLNNVLVVHPALKVNSVADIIAQAKAAPGAMNFASSGSGTSIHMSGEMFKSMAGVNLVHIPYKGSSPATTDLMGGQVMMMFDNIPSSMPHIKSGKLRAIATTGAKRDPSLPDLPTIAESGVPGYEASVWFGLMSPLGLPKEIVNKLSTEVGKASKSADYVHRMSEMGFIVMGTSPEQMAQMNKEEVARWGPIVKASGAKAD
jgi:tripartite-type tricarboxylate transporter receptor subunit TctC